MAKCAKNKSSRKAPSSPVLQRVVPIDLSALRLTTVLGRGMQQEEEKRLAKEAAAAALKAIGTTANPYAAAFKVMGPIAAKAWSHSDAAGWAHVFQGGGFSEPVELRVSTNNITPPLSKRPKRVTSRQRASRTRPWASCSTRQVGRTWRSCRA
jgi:hypothetical protein